MPLPLWDFGCGVELNRCHYHPVRSITYLLLLTWIFIDERINGLLSVLKVETEGQPRSDPLPGVGMHRSNQCSSIAVHLFSIPLLSTSHHVLGMPGNNNASRADSRQSPVGESRRGRRVRSSSSAILADGKTGILGATMQCRDRWRGSGVGDWHLGAIHAIHSSSTLPTVAAVTISSPLHSTQPSMHPSLARGTRTLETRV